MLIYESSYCIYFIYTFLRVSENTPINCNNFLVEYNGHGFR